MSFENRRRSGDLAILSEATDLLALLDPAGRFFAALRLTSVDDSPLHDPMMVNHASLEMQHRAGTVCDDLAL